MKTTLPTQSLSTVDSIFLLTSALGVNNDIILAWVFSNGSSVPTVEAINTHFRSRERYVVDAMNCRVREFPGRLDRPYWIRHDVPIVDRITHHDSVSGFGWSRLIESAVALCEPDSRIDASQAAWRLHVFRNVDQVPDLEGTATVVVLHASHSLLSGMELESVGTALFGAEPTPLVLKGRSHIHATPRGTVAAISALCVFPVHLLQAGVGIYRNRKTSLFTIHEDHPLCEPTVFNNGSGPVRGNVVRLDGDRFRRLRVSPSVLMLTVVGSAITSYFESIDEPVPDHLVSSMTFAIDDPMGELGVNGVHDARIDISADGTTPERAARIASALKSEIERGHSKDITELRRALFRAPWPVIRKQVTKMTTQDDEGLPVFATVLSTTINLGKAPLALGDAPCAFAFLPHHLGRSKGVSHYLIRTGADYSLTIATSADATVDIQAYGRCLSQALDEACSELSSAP